MKIWIGTSGFQYPEWKGKFYPEKISPGAMLAYYSERFSSTEVNYSFRRIPSAETISRWATATPDEFRFSFKAPQRVTHFAKLRGTEEVFGAFWNAISMMEQKLGAILLQLPPTFRKDTVLLDAFLGTLPSASRAAFEFRHPSWFEDDVFATLKKHNAALCIAETEELATPKVATADFGCLRLRREDYTQAEIQQWAEFVASPERSWQEAFVYFKHEEKAVGPKFAEEFQRMVEPR